MPIDWKERMNFKLHTAGTKSITQLLYLFEETNKTLNQAKNIKAQKWWCTYRCSKYGCCPFQLVSVTPPLWIHTHTNVLQLSGFCLGQPRWAGTRRNIHPLTLIVAISHPLSASSIYYDPWHPPCSIYMPDSLFPQSISKFSSVYLFAWHPPLHTPYIYSPNYCLLLQHMPIPSRPVLL